MFPHRRIIALTTVLLAVACFVLAVMWPQWRSDIGAQGYYGYGYGYGGYKCSVSITNSTVTKNIPSRIEAILTATDKYFITLYIYYNLSIAVFSNLCNPLCT